MNNAYQYCLLIIIYKFIEKLHPLTAEALHLKTLGVPLLCFNYFFGSLEPLH